MNASNWKLSPSDFAFLWEECKRCFYLKVARDFRRPWTPMPKIFIKIDGLMKAFFEGKPIDEIATTLPAGVVRFGEKWVESQPIAIPGHTSQCFIRGKFDTVVEFEDGSYGIIDFKTSETKSEHIPLYSRQLHAYAYALENPAPGKLALGPITKLGLLCVEPTHIDRGPDGRISYVGDVAWIECPRNDAQFMDFLGQVLDVLEQPEPPPAASSCGWCRYRNTARRTGL
ncbi:MAG: PD-(D/E)XK nuclease family protein [candidate division WOR-3 bacterium]|nr:PD-(D/E)XK nuclease family protein [candidate division WOR-3 bacterium]